MSLRKPVFFSPGQPLLISRLYFSRHFHSSRYCLRNNKRPPNNNNTTPKDKKSTAAEESTAKPQENKEEKAMKDSKQESKSFSNLEKALNVIENSIMSSMPSAKDPKRVPLMKSFLRPLFPGFYKAISVVDKPAIELIQKRVSQNKPYLGVFMAKNSDTTFHNSGIAEPLRIHDDAYNIGSLCQIYNVLPGPNDSITLLLYPHRRIVMKNNESHDELVQAISPASTLETIEPINEEPEIQIERDKIIEDYVQDFPDTIPTGDVTPLIQETLDILGEISNLNPLIKDQMAEFMRTLGFPTASMFTASKFRDVLPKLADFAASMCDADPDALQAIMSEPHTDIRLERANALLQKELLNAELQSEIRKETDKMVGERDRVGFLKSRLRSIQRELGLELVAKEKLIEKYQARCEKLKLNAAIRKIVDDEIAKLSHLRPSSQEYNLTTNYLDWLTQVPWGKYSDENLDIEKAEFILNEDHYGMNDVKERILEFVAVANLKGGVQGKILCLAGPPGVGKTSIGKSISRALNREFYRFSVGGLYDVAEIRGHRRTYVGAMPGKLVQALKNVQTQNPLILIDEVDKISNGGPNGDPSAALLEVLDPEQNATFVDHYLDTAIDLSKVLFVCTANVLENIPGPLLDRMEVINLSGYIADEKKEIAKQYLIPTAQKLAGLQSFPIQVTDDALEELMIHYCRESGVRNLKKQIEKIFRKAAYQIVENEEDGKQEEEVEKKQITVSKENLRQYVGKPLFITRRLFDDPPAGVIMGLAYNAYGGSSLYIESVAEARVDKKKSKGAKFVQTGNMGDVMKESSQIAYSYAKHFLESRNHYSDFFRTTSVHLHVPEGATPKDGPSAGIAMCSSLISLALDKKPKLDVAMTGELTLTGRVLKIGGLKEKLLAAKRSAVKDVIIPYENKSDYESLDDNVKTGIEVHFVKTFDEVYHLLFA